jgi:hypothetical protein
MEEIVRHSRLRYSLVIAAIATGVTCGPPAAKAVDLDELTVVTLSRDGAWGVATAHSQGPAIAAAIRDCRAMARGPSDCGAQFATTRGGWVHAGLCGSHKIVVAAETPEAVEQAAIKRENDLKQYYGTALPPCRRVVTVGPSGAVLVGEAATAHQVEARRGKH